MIKYLKTSIWQNRFQLRQTLIYDAKTFSPIFLITLHKRAASNERTKGNILFSVYIQRQILFHSIPDPATASLNIQDHLHNIETSKRGFESGNWR
jgi:hypothetical protein